MLAFKIGGKAALPELPAAVSLPLDPPPEIGDAETWKVGKALYHAYCGMCHGDAAVSGVLPDLRLSPLNRHAEAWDAVVRGGIRAATGMVSFSSAISAADGERIRAYVIHRAHEDRALDNAAAAPK